MTVEEMFWQKVSKTDNCWVWTAYKCVDGYGRFKFEGAARLAHRVAYELLVGKIPDGLQIDHLCRNRACVNPDHLEPVTSRENTLRSPISLSAIRARQTHCLRGHSLAAHAFVRSDGARVCRLCLQVRRGAL